MSAVELTHESFEAVVARGGVVVVDFWEPGCGPCTAFAPVYDRVSRHHPAHVFARIDVAAEPALAELLGITAVPTLMVFRDGVPLLREPGALDERGLEGLIAQIESLDMDRINRAIAELVRETTPANEREQPRG